jgi:peptidoglycan lytic transglycosylase D
LPFEIGNRQSNRKRPEPLKRTHFERIIKIKMRLAQKAGRGGVVLIIVLLLISAIGPATVFGQSSAKPASANVQSIIDQAEAIFRQGQEAFVGGQMDVARKLFDQAIDIVLTSGIDVRKDSKLDTYYRDLLERIHKYEAQPDDNHAKEQAPEVVEPSVLDELSGIKESDLAMVTPEGIKIFGKYDFDFSVAAPVFQFINFFVAGRGRSTMEVGLQRSGRYRQLAEKIFKEERVPLDLIWLAQAESVWKPNALSWAAAKGIWQFIPSTGSRYGLAQTSWVDQRSHPEMSTRAAARYLKFLHEFFAGDWLLAMAAYNSGEYRVAGAISKCGYADFWELHRRGLLPAETRNYVPIILAIMIVSKNQKRYGFNVKPDSPLNYDLFELPTQTDLKVVADLLTVPYETVQEMNPELRRGVTPPDQRYMIKIPKGTRKQFEFAYASLPETERVRRVVIPREEIAEVQRPAYRTQLVSYRVRRGDTLAALARRHGVSEKELARINRMSSRGELRRGQAIRIPKSIRSGPKSIRSRRGRVAHSKVRASRYTTRKAVRSRHSSRGTSKGIRRPTSRRRR